MDFTFSSNKLEKQCTQEKAMSKAFTKAICKKLQLRMTELNSATTLDELLSGPGSWHTLTADRADQIAGLLDRHVRIVITVDTEAKPQEAQVIEIIDYHD